MQQSFDEWLDESAEHMSRLAFQLTHSREEALDLAQETYLRLYRSWNNRLSPGARVVYARRAMLHIYLNERARTTVRTRRAALDPGERLRHGSDATWAIDARDALWRAMGELSKQQRSALVLRYYEDLTDDEIAQLLHCKSGTVRSHLKRGIDWLRDDTGLQLTVQESRHE